MAKNQLSLADRAFVKLRAGGYCEYCQFPFDYSHDAFHFDHIIPPKKGGTNEIENIAFSCDRCNSKKGIKTEWPDPGSGVKSPLFNPRNDKWQEHFTWSKDFASILGLTPKGNATIDLLEMNRPGLVNVRKALHKYGVHPPS